MVAISSMQYSRTILDATTYPPLNPPMHTQDVYMYHIYKITVVRLSVMGDQRKQT